MRSYFSEITSRIRVGKLSLSAEESMRNKVSLFIGAHLAMFISLAALIAYGGGG
jgi:hypothetical protein